MQIYLKTKLDEIEYKDKESIAELQELISIINTEITNPHNDEEEFTMPFTKYYNEYVKPMEIGVDNKELFYEIKNESARILKLFIDRLKVEYHPIVIDENGDYKAQDNRISYITLQTENKYLSFFKGLESINRPLNIHSRIGEFIIITSQNNYIPNEITISFNGYRDDKLPQYMQDEITSAILELKK